MPTYTALYSHVVFATRNRRALITPRLRLRLDPYISAIISRHGGRLWRPAACRLINTCCSCSRQQWLWRIA